MKKLLLFIAFFVPMLASAQVDRIELGYQSTRRGIVWYRPGLPTHQPIWKFSRDTNAVMWHDTLTSIRYDWEYLNDLWRSKGTFTGSVPPLDQQTSGSATVDNTQALWIRDTFNIIHRWDIEADAWVPISDFFLTSDVPTAITETGSNGAAIYTRAIWQDSDDNIPYYWDGAAWVTFGGGTVYYQTLRDDNVSMTQRPIANFLSTIRINASLIDDPGNTETEISFDLAQQGATSGQVLKWDGFAWSPGNDQTGSITSVNNGLTLSGSIAQQGGTFIQNTTLDQNSFQVNYKDGKFTHARYNNNITGNLAAVEIEGKYGDPNVSGATEDAVFTLRGSNNGTPVVESLSFGVDNTTNEGVWMQSRDYNNHLNKNPLKMQPRGGQFSVGRMSGLDALATFSGVSLTGTGVDGSVVHVEASESSAVTLSLGAGIDALDSELSWYDATDALRLTNHSTVNGSSSVRVAIGGPEDDRVLFIRSSATSKVLAGFGFDNPTDVHSTMHSAGSIAGAALTTLGNPDFDETKFAVIYTGTVAGFFTLPNQADVKGRIFWIMNHSSHDITLTKNVKTTSGSSFAQITSGQYAIFISDGSEYRGFRGVSL